MPATDPKSCRPPVTATAPVRLWRLHVACVRLAFRACGASPRDARPASRSPAPPSGPVPPHSGRAVLRPATPGLRVASASRLAAARSRTRHWNKVSFGVPKQCGRTRSYRRHVTGRGLFCQDGLEFVRGNVRRAIADAERIRPLPERVGTPAPDRGCEDLGPIGLIDGPIVSANDTARPRTAITPSSLILRHYGVSRSHFISGPVLRVTRVGPGPAARSGQDHGSRGPPPASRSPGRPGENQFEAASLLQDLARLNATVVPEYRHAACRRTPGQTQRASCPPHPDAPFSPILSDGRKWA